MSQGRIVLWTRSTFISFWIIRKSIFESKFNIRRFWSSHMVSLIRLEVNIFSQVIIIFSSSIQGISGISSYFPFRIFIISKLFSSSNVVSWSWSVFAPKICFSHLFASVFFCLMFSIACSKSKDWIWFFIRCALFAKSWINLWVFEFYQILVGKRLL